MTQDIWIGIEVADGTATGWRFDGTAVLEQASRPTLAEVLEQLGDGPALIVDQTDATQPVPAPVLPDTLPLPALLQDRPRGHLDATARLRIAGALATRRNWDGVVCLPMAKTTHWCQISADEVVSFQSALTPVLAQALGASDHAATEAVADTMSRPERLSVHLRGATLTDARDDVAGHLVGAELAAMRAYWLGQQIIVIAANGLYSGALSAQGVPIETLHPNNAAREGLLALKQKTC